jgi:hypothetical protein
VWLQGLPLPADRSMGSAAAGEGVWVLGLIRGSAADAAGLGQGDQLLELDGSALAGQSPFAVASALQGPEDEVEAVGPDGGAAPVQIKASGAQLKSRLIGMCATWLALIVRVPVCSWQGSECQLRGGTGFAVTDVGQPPPPETCTPTVLP